MQITTWVCIYAVASDSGPQHCGPLTLVQSSPRLCTAYPLPTAPHSSYALVYCTSLHLLIDRFVNCPASPWRSQCGKRTFIYFSLRLQSEIMSILLTPSSNQDNANSCESQWSIKGQPYWSALTGTPFWRWAPDRAVERPEWLEGRHPARRDPITGP